MSISMLKKLLTTLCLLLLGISSALAAPAKKSLVLSLKDAVYLAVSRNNALYSAELNRITQKYSVLLARNAFEPQYSFKTGWNRTISENQPYSDSISIDPSVSLKTLYGTQLSLTGSYSKSWPGDNSHSLLLSVTQPLLKGFGKDIVDQALLSAIDQERLNKLNFKDTAEQTINTAIKDYLQVINDKINLDIDNTTLESNKITLKNTNILVAAGRRAKIDILQPQSDVAQQKSKINQDNRTLRNDKYALLDFLNMPHNAELTIPKNVNFESLEDILGARKLPSLNVAQKMALANSADYQTAKQTLVSARRSLLSAKNDRLWDLEFSARTPVGNQGEGSTDKTLGLSLDVPIDNLSTKEAVIAAKIALIQAENSLKEGEQNLLRSVEDKYESLDDIKKQIGFSQESLKLQQKDVELAYINYNNGKISSLDYSTQYKNLNAQAQSVVSSEISYVNSLAEYSQILGVTLDDWGIKIRY